MPAESINVSACTGCGTCVDACVMDVIRLEEGKAVIRYPEDCVACSLCVQACPVGAVKMTPLRGRPITKAW